MGGASQGNQGITFGGRRQITSPAPKVPSLAEKERRRREAEAETERLRAQAEETEQKRRLEREAEEEQERRAEQERWAEATRKQREQEQRRLEEEKRRWEEEERKWQEEEEARAHEERAAEARLERERLQKRAGSDTRLQGQFLSQYQAEQRQLPPNQIGEDPARTAERERVKELERELAMAKEREKQYERERLERLTTDRGRSQNGLMTSNDRARSRSRPLPTAPTKPQKQDVSDQGQPSEQDFLRQEWSKYNSEDVLSSPELPQAPPQPPRPLPSPAPYQQPARNLHTPSTQSHHPPHAADEQPPPQPPRPLPTPSPSLPLPIRPLPDPKTYTSPSATPSPSKQPQSMKPSPFAPKLPSSLLHREMELDRQRQQKWEEGQKATKEAAARGVGAGETIGPAGESWDVHQYGYLGGDSQNNVGTGIGFGARRQIMGPRPGPGGR